MWNKEGSKDIRLAYEAILLWKNRTYKNRERKVPHVLITKLHPYAAPSHFEIDPRHHIILSTSISLCISKDKNFFKNKTMILLSHVWGISLENLLILMQMNQSFFIWLLGFVSFLEMSSLKDYKWIYISFLLVIF